MFSMGLSIWHPVLFGSRGIVDLVQNGDFATGIDGWVGARGNETLSYVDGKLRVTASASGAYGTSTQIDGLTVASDYNVVLNGIDGPGGAISYRLAENSALGAGLVITRGDPIDQSATATAETLHLGGIAVASVAGDYFEITLASFTPA